MRDTLNKNDVTKEVTWTWSTDPLGRITSVSTQFYTMINTLSQNIIGNTFWNFCEGSEKPTADWMEFYNAIKAQRRIRKFIFHVHTQGNFIKLKLTGEAVFEKGRFLGHRGVGSRCEDDEYTTSEISHYNLSSALENMNIGIGVFNKEGLLDDFNAPLNMHLTLAGINVKHGMTIMTITSHLKARHQLDYEMSNAKNNPSETEMIFTLSGKTILTVRLHTLSDGTLYLKTEPIQNMDMLSKFKLNQEKIKSLQEERFVLQKKLDDYKHKYNDISPDYKNTEDNSSKILAFYENQLDIGILVTDLAGNILSLNYATANFFNYRTIKDYLADVKNTADLVQYDPYRQDLISSMLENSIPRTERLLEIVNHHETTHLKEVITIYPSIVSPEKIVSFFYENPSALDEESGDSEKNNISNDFIEYILKDIKTSLQVISGYSDLNTMQKTSSAQKNNVEYITQSCHGILKRINDVSYLYMTMAKVNYLEYKKFNPEKIIHHICASLHQDITHKNIDLKIEFLEQELHLICDEKLFESAMTKLIENAIYISEKFSIVKIRILGDRQTKKLSFLICDEGNINLEEELQISENHDDVKHNTNHAIYNLKIAKIFLNKMGFTLNVTSFVGLGNTICVETPEELLVSPEQSDKNNVVI